MFLGRTHITISHHGVTLRPLLIEFLFVALTVLLANYNFIVLDQSICLCESRILLGIELELIFLCLVLGISFLLDLAAEPI